MTRDVNQIKLKLTGLQTQTVKTLAMNEVEALLSLWTTEPENFSLVVGHTSLLNGVKNSDSK